MARKIMRKNILFIIILLLIPNLLSQSDLQRTYESASKYAQEGNYGNALLRYLEISIKDSYYKDIQKQIELMESAIRDRVTFRVALFDFKNYSGSPALAGKIQDGILDFLLNKSFGTLEIVDRSALVQFQKEAERTGMKLEEFKPLSAVIEGSIYELKVEDNKMISTETKTVQIGTHKVPNPNRAEIMSAINTLRFQEPDYAYLHQAQVNRVLQKEGAFGTLFNLKQASKLDFASAGLEFLRLLETDDAKSKVEKRIKQLESEMSITPEFIEEPVYGDIVKNEETLARIARMECYLKIRDFKSRRPLYTQTFESIKSAIGKLTNIPSKLELESLVTREVIISAGDKLFRELGDYGLGYYSLFELARNKGDKFSAIEMVFNYLISCSSSYNAEQTINCFNFINESIGLKADSEILDNYFPAIESAINYVEEKRRYLKAKEIFEQGITLYNQEDYESAVEKFKQSQNLGFESSDLDKYIAKCEDRIAELKREKLYSQKLTEENKHILMNAMETTDKSPYSLFELPAHFNKTIVHNDIDILDTKKAIGQNGVIKEIHFSPDNEYVFFIYFTSLTLQPPIYYLYNIKLKQLKLIKNLPGWYNNEIRYKHDILSNRADFHYIIVGKKQAETGYWLRSGKYYVNTRKLIPFFRGFKISDEVEISLHFFSSIEEAIQNCSVWLPNKKMLLTSQTQSGGYGEENYDIKLIDPLRRLAIKLGIKGKTMCISNDLKRIVFVKKHYDWTHIHLANISFK